jgi:DNA-binding PadR family transcriptional regulator
MTPPLEKSPLTEAAYYILLSLYEPMHGYGIMQNVKMMSSDRVNLGPGTLYGAINTLLEKGWIISAGESDSRKKEYQITESGKKVVSYEIQRLEELLKNGKKITGAEQ